MISVSHVQEATCTRWDSTSSRHVQLSMTWEVVAC